jgi:hypothetical protein
MLGRKSWGAFTNTRPLDPTSLSIAWSVQNQSKIIDFVWGSISGQGPDPFLHPPSNLWMLPVASQGHGQHCGFVSSTRFEFRDKSRGASRALRFVSNVLIFYLFWFALLFSILPVFVFFSALVVVVFVILSSLTSSFVSLHAA